MKRFVSILAAMVLSLTLVVPALAASQTVTESLTVPASLSVTGVPSSVDYGSKTPGQTGTANINVTITANTAWSLTIAGTNLTSGSNTIGETNRTGTINVSSGTPATTYSGLGSPIAFGNAPYNGLTNVMTGTPTTGTVVFNMVLALTVPGGTPAGTYTGSVTFSLN